MALHSAVFVAFLGAACFTVYLFPKKQRYVWILVCNCAFYIWTCRGFPLQTPSFLVKLGLPDSLPACAPAMCLLGGTALCSWLCALGIQKSKPAALRVFFLCLNTAALAALLAGCKYFGLLAPFRLHVGGIVTEGNANGFTQIALPLGLSYYTLQAVAYGVDVFFKRAKAETNPLRYAAFLTFFPGIVLGPTARAGQMLPQLAQPAAFDYETIAGGLFRILWGFFKKVVLADNIAVFTAYVFGATTANAGPVLLIALLLFIWQVYLDFSGCCDIAIGAAGMLGFVYPENFMRPFSATSFAGLWRRWLMSIGGFFRDCLYAPVAENPLAQKVPALRWPFGLVGGFLCFGALAAWHGLSLDWLWWGLATGLLFALSGLLAPVWNTLAEKVPLYRKPKVRAAFQRVFTFLLFAFTMAFFASALYQQPLFEWAPALGQSWGVLASGEFLPALWQAGLSGPHTPALLLGSVLVIAVEHFAVGPDSTVAGWIRAKRFYVRWPLYLMLLAALVLFGVFPVTSGIYQSF
ncbi:hypothetical protein LJB76_01310 [Clostridia bacterium OttesenSCG-928-O13]|nr:hypothetical protein [Clostridia bacterium OttesenSCG-928-O13]